MSKTTFKSMHNWRRYPSSNCYEIDQKTRFEIWCSVVVPSDATDKNCNIGAQLLSILYTTAEKKILENLLPVGLLVHTNLFTPSRFWTTYTNFDTCCQC